MTGPACYRLLKMWTIAGFSPRAGIDTSGLGLWGEFQIRSKQDWERGLSGGVTDGNTRGLTGVLSATRGAAEGTDIAAD